MTTESLRAVLAALERSKARYLVVGGVAVVAHGFVRLTDDLDVVLRLGDPAEVRCALDALAEVGYQPLVPVPLAHFADADIRRSWVVGKRAKVFQLFSDRLPTLRVDLFLEEPFDFDRALADSRVVTLDRVQFRVASIADLIAMKREAGRAKDLDDIEHLEALERWDRER